MAGLDRVTPSQGMQESPPARIAGFSEMVCGSPTPREGGCREAPSRSYPIPAPPLRLTLLDSGLSDLCTHFIDFFGSNAQHVGS